MKRIPILILILVACSFAGNGKIKGTITNAETGESLPGVNIHLLETATSDIVSGAATNLDGKYWILNIKPGIYKLKASYIGYETHTVDSVEVFADSTTTTNISLNALILEGGIGIVMPPLRDIRDNVVIWDDITDTAPDAELGDTTRPARISFLTSRLTPLARAILIEIEWSGIDNLNIPPLQIEIYDTSGRLVEKETPQFNEELGRTGMSGWPFVWNPDTSLGTGFYLIRATVGNESITKRVVYFK